MEKTMSDRRQYQPRSDMSSVAVFIGAAMVFSWAIHAASRPNTVPGSDARLTDVAAMVAECEQLHGKCEVIIQVQPQEGE